MKKLIFLPIFLFLSACTQDSVVKNTALRYVVINFDNELKAKPEAKDAEEIRKNTEITVENVKMNGENEALVNVQIKTIQSASDKTSVIRQVPVKVVKKGVWSVEEANPSVNKEP